MLKKMITAKHPTDYPLKVNTFDGLEHILHAEEEAGRVLYVDY